MTWKTDKANGFTEIKGNTIRFEENANFDDQGVQRFTLDAKNKQSTIRRISAEFEKNAKNATALKLSFETKEESYLKIYDLSCYGKFF